MIAIPLQERLTLSVSFRQSECFYLKEYYPQDSGGLLALYLYDLICGGWRSQGNDV
ncbi:MAG: hypothetical protein PUP93_15130 [Rhizonema sp. NSF051]|nr:hypothetical protein [Rhizonema sp. NSF051]